MVKEAIAESGERIGAVSRVARHLGLGQESVRSWYKQAEIDGGQRPGATSEERRRIAELEREVRKPACRGCAEDPGDELLIHVLHRLQLVSK